MSEPITTTPIPALVLENSYKIHNLINEVNQDLEEAGITGYYYFEYRSPNTTITTNQENTDYLNIDTH